MNWLTQPLHAPDLSAWAAAWHRWREGAWREWPMWPLPVQLACGLACGLLSGAMVWGLWPTPAPDIERLSLAHQALQAQLATQQTNLSRDAPQNPASAASVQALTLAQKRWPTAAQVQSVMLTAYRQAQTQGLQWDFFKPEALLSAQTFAVQPLSLRLRGSFAQILAWRDDLLQESALWVPDQWTLATQSDGQLTLDAVLHLYLRPEESLALQAAPVAQELDTAVGSLSWQAGSALRSDPFHRPATQRTEPMAVQPLGDDVHPLHRWPLQALAMVGTFSGHGWPYALVQTPAGLFSVSVGDRLGAEGGRVVGLDETRMQVRVRAPQGSGRWQERQTDLTIRRTAPP